MNTRGMMKVRALKLNRELYAIITDKEDAFGVKTKTSMKRLKRLFDLKEKIKRNGGTLILNDISYSLTDRAIHPSDLEKYNSIDIDRKI